MGKNKNVKNLIPGLKENVSLKNHTSFRIGGPAKYFLEAKTKKEIIQGILAAKKLKLPFFVLGGGSNILVSDKGFKGLVIKTLNTKYKILNTKIIAGAGTMLGQLVSGASKKGLTGLEWAAGIPGTLAGAIYGNAGSAGESMGDVVKEVEVFDVNDLKVKKFKNRNCKFSYRESIFKKRKNFIVLSVSFQLEMGNKKEIEEKVKKILDRKKNRQPLNFPSAGSVFKNPVNFFAGELIEKCGLKGKIIGRVAISEKHANFIVNLGGGKAKDVLKLINLIKKQVKNKFGVKLEEEIEIL